jgi:hypothetical protein
MDIVGTANGLNSGNLIPTLTHTNCMIHRMATPLPSFYAILKRKKGLACMQASIRPVTNAVTSISGSIERSDYEWVKPPLTSAAKSPAQPRPPAARCRRAGIDTRTVDYEVRTRGREGMLIMTVVMTMTELPMTWQPLHAPPRQASPSSRNYYTIYRQVLSCGKRSVCCSDVRLISWR